MLEIDPKKETKRIIDFVGGVLKKANKNKVILGLSGGIDSATSLYLLKKSIGPKNIIVAYLHYFEQLNLDFLINDLPKENIHNILIKKIVDSCANQLHIRPARLASESFAGRKNQKLESQKIRIGNIAARIRMTLLYDIAKKENALVCGTENKSEHLLGYFTRFGDEASDFEPIMHLYKTQVYQLAKHLKIPEEIIEKTPSADLWQGQTDEGELSFSYKEADPVLYLYFEKKLTVDEIKNKSFKNAEKIINRALNNKYKHRTPYCIRGIKKV